MIHLIMSGRLPSWLISVLILLPITSFAASFDCSKTNKIVEDIICEAKEISAYDEKMADIYFSIRDTLDSKGKKVLIQSQRNFIVTRNKCHHNMRDKLTVDSVFRARDCLLEAYQNRISELNEWDSVPTHSVLKSKPKDSLTTKARCPNISESELVFIPGGTFYMGSSERPYSDEKPRHKVIVDNFCISKRPIENEWISFNESIKYLKKLSEKYGTNIRLLTEAEWEYVASMGTVDNQYKVIGLMHDWELTSTVYTKYPYDKNDGRENLYADDAFRVLRGGYPLDPRSDYEPTITLRGYASQETGYMIRIASDPLY